jgi:hypothetical protein
MSRKSEHGYRRLLRIIVSPRCSPNRRRKCLPTDAFIASLEQGLRHRLKPEKPGPKPQERNHFTGGLFDELERNWVNSPRNSALDKLSSEFLCAIHLLE